MQDLPYRQGARPKTNYGLPHQQLDQNPPPEVYAKLKDRAYDFPFVERRASIISVPGAEAFLRGNEFAHVHPPYDGSMHMMLPEDAVSDALERGWGEPHPLVPEGLVPPTAVMIFGPRDEGELQVILKLIDASYRFARGV